VQPRPSAQHPGALARSALLHLANHADAWPRWLGEAGIAHADSLAGPVFDDAMLAVEAAIQGQGVAIAPRFAVEQDIESGRLVAPFALGVPSGRHYYLSWPKAKARMPKVRLFRDFILAAE
jgi:DNA-binding transcriptional LysR family regulator